ncbi:MAG: hypothetical protein ACREUE_07315 [Panacagrimonas sp.]
MSTAASLPAAVAAPTLGFEIPKEFLAAPSAAASALPVGSAKGSFVVDGKVVELRHAYATQTIVPEKDAPGATLSQRNVVEIVLSEKELSSAMVHSELRRAASSMAGTFRGVSFYLHENAARNPSLIIFYPIIPTGTWNVVPEGDEMRVEVGDFALRGDTISGRLGMTAAESARMKLSEDEADSWQVMTTSFSSRLESPPQPKELDKPATLKSPWFAALLAWSSMVSAKDFGRMGDVLTGMALAEQRERLQKKGPAAMGSGGSAQEAAEQLVSSSATSDEATVVIKPYKDKPFTYSVQLLLMDGKWKLARFQM